MAVTGKDSPSKCTFAPRQWERAIIATSHIRLKIKGRQHPLTALIQALMRDPAHPKGHAVDPELIRRQGHHIKEVDPELQGKIILHPDYREWMQRIKERTINVHVILRLVCLLLPRQINEKFPRLRHRGRIAWVRQISRIFFIHHHTVQFETRQVHSHRAVVHDPHQRR